MFKNMRPSKARVEATSYLINARLRESTRVHSTANPHYFTFDSEGDLVDRWTSDTAVLAEQHPHLPIRKVRKSCIRTWMPSLSMLGDLYNFLISITACVVYVFQTYNEKNYVDLFLITNALLSTLFAIDWLYHLVTAKNKWSFIWNRMTAVDMLTIIPAYIEVLGVTESLANLSFFRMMRVFRVLRVLRMYKLFSFRSIEDDDLQLPQNSLDSSGISKQIAILGMTLFSLLFIGAGIVHSIDTLSPNSYYSPDQEFDFFMAFYYMIVTSSTLGYGDIYPITTLSRMVCVGLVMSMVLILGDQLGRISQLMAHYSKYDRRYNFSEHIVVMGFYQPHSLYRFLFEFYHPDHGDNKKRCIIVGEQSPTEEICSLMETAQFDSRVHYLEGKPTYESTLRKANVSLADTVFVMTDQQGKELEANDSNAMLIVKAVQDHAQFVKTCVQLVRPAALTYANWASWSTVVSTQEMKMGILGTSIHNRGFSTLVTGLHTSVDISMERHSEVEWVMQYTHGLAQEIYCIELSPYFYGKPFAVAARTLYLTAGGILLIAVRTTNTSTHQEEVLINPAAYAIGEGDFGYVIAADLQTASKVSSYTVDLDSIATNDISLLTAESLAQAFKNSRKNSRTYKADIESGEVIELWCTDLHEKLINHVVVFGSIEGFSLLVASIRNYSKQAVCLVSSDEPDVIWNKLKCKFENIYYLKGSILNFQEIFNCAIEDSYAVLILTSHNKESFTPDSDAVLGAKSIEMCFPNARVLLELGDESYLRFLGNRPRGRFEELPYTMWPKYVSGRCYLSTYLDTLLCQAYYNPELVQILLKLLGFNKYNPRLEQYKENLLIRTIHIPHVYFKGEGKTSRTYGELFNDLLSLNPPVIPLGILSKRYVGKNDPTKVDFEIVFTNPLPTALIDKDDSVICLGDHIGDKKAGGMSRIETISKPKLELQDLMDMGIKEQLWNAKGTEVESVENEEEKREEEGLEHLLESLKYRLFTQRQLHHKIESKTKLLQELHRDTERLKEELIRRNGGGESPEQSSPDSPRGDN